MPDIKKYHDQCFLMDYMQRVSNLKGSEIEWAPKHVSEIYNINTPPALTFLNRVTGGAVDQKGMLSTFESGQNLLENVPEALLESLQPTVKIYKVHYRPGDPPEGSLTPLPFGNMSQSIGKGLNPGDLSVNLEKFSFHYEGVNPAEVDYYIRAKMTLFCSSVDAFFHQYDRRGATASFSDLIKRPGAGGYMAQRKSHLKYDENSFRIFAEIFYDMPGQGIIDQYKSIYPASRVENFFSALKASKISFFLNLIKHEVKIETEVPSSPFRIEIDYVAAVETAMGSPSANVLQPWPWHKAQLAAGQLHGTEQRLEDMKAMIRQAQSRDPNSNIARVFDNAAVDMLGESTRTGTIRDQHKSEFAFNSLSEMEREATAEALDQGVLQSIFGGSSGGVVDINQYKLTHAHRAELYSYSSGRGYHATSTTGIDTLFRRAGVQFNAKNFVIASRYYEALARHEAYTTRSNIGPTSVKRARYTRFLLELMGIDREGNRARPSRVYNVTLPGASLTSWINNRQSGTLSYEEIRNLRKAEVEGNYGKAQKLKQARETAQANARQFNQDFWNRHMASSRAGTVQGTPQDFDLTAWKENVKETVLAANEQASGNITTPPEPYTTPQARQPISHENYQIQWVYLGDIIDVAIGLAREDQDKFMLKFNNWGDYADESLEAGNINIVFGPCSYYDLTLGKDNIISLARVPISLKLFNEFWHNRVISKNIDTYSLQRFIKDVLADLVSSSFTNLCALPGDKKNNVRATYDHVTLDPTVKPSEGLVTLYRERGQDKCPVVYPGRSQAAWRAMGTLRGRSKLTSAVALTNYGAAPASWYNVAKKNDQAMFLHCYTNEMKHLKGSYSKDIPNGIYHIRLGETGVPIKQISFSKADIPFYLEAKGERAGLANNPLELSEPYNVSFRIHGNTSFRVGRHFYLVLPHFGEPILRKARGTKATMMGLGGYFMVVKSDNFIEASGARVDWYTDVEAYWVSFADRLPDPTAATATTPAANARLNSLESELNTDTEKFIEALKL